jgi:hypothetical protein
MNQVDIDLLSPVVRLVRPRLIVPQEIHCFTICIRVLDGIHPEQTNVPLDITSLLFVEYDQSGEHSPNDDNIRSESSVTSADVMSMMRSGAHDNSEEND